MKKTERYYPSDWEDEKIFKDEDSRTVTFDKDGNETVDVYKNPSPKVSLNDIETKEVKDNDKQNDKNEKNPEKNGNLSFIILLIVVAVLAFVLGFSLRHHSQVAKESSAAIEQKENSYKIAMRMTYISNDNNQHDVYFLCKNQEQVNQIMSTINQVKSGHDLKLAFNLNGSHTIPSDKIIALNRIEISKNNESIIHSNTATSEQPSIFDGNDE